MDCDDAALWDEPAQPQTATAVATLSEGGTSERGSNEELRARFQRMIFKHHHALQRFIDDVLPVDEDAVVPVQRSPAKKLTSTLFSATAAPWLQARTERRPPTLPPPQMVVTDQGTAAPCPLPGSIEEAMSPSTVDPPAVRAAIKDCGVKHCVTVADTPPPIKQPRRGRTRMRVDREPSSVSGVVAWLKTGSQRNSLRSSLRSLTSVETSTCRASDLSTFQRIIFSRGFEWISTVLVLSNAIFLGVQCQWRASETIRLAKYDIFMGQDDSGGWLVAQVVFCLTFLIELVLRWTADGFIEFFQTPETKWNLFDFIIVLFSVFDVMVSLIGTNTAWLMNASFLRVMRVVRIVRVVRVIRILKFFRELRMMVYAIMRSMKLLLWALLIMTLLVFTFGVSITTGTLDFVAGDEKWNHPEYANLIAWFGTLDRSTLNLYMAMSGGRDWGEYHDAMQLLPGSYQFLFMVFITFSTLAVVNIVTGIFVDSAFQCSRQDRESLVAEELTKREKYLQDMRSVFHEIDEDGAGQITVEEFEQKLTSDERVKAYFAAIKLDVGDAAKLFALLDYDGSGSVDIEEFLSGCSRLKGESRALDIAMLKLEVSMLSERIGKFLDRQQNLREPSPRLA